MNFKLYIAAEGGSVYQWNIDKKELLPFYYDESNETMMGLAQHQGHLYAAGKSFIVKLKGHHVIERAVFKYNPDFHQMNWIDNGLNVTCTSINQVWSLDDELKVKRYLGIAPPKTREPVEYKKNYNHINNVFYNNGGYYVNLNWFSAQQYGMSGVAIYDHKFEHELSRYEYGWESHAFCFIKTKEQWSLVGSSAAIHKINHQHKAGLMIDGKIVFEHDPDEYFCKDFSLDKEHVYIVGGTVASRDGRAFADGVLFILDRNTFELKDKVVFKTSGGFCGCLLDEVDFSKNL